MKFGVVNKSLTVNRFVLHTLQRNITHLAVITRKTNIKLGILKGGNWKRAECIKAAYSLTWVLLIVLVALKSAFATQPEDCHGDYVWTNGSSISKMFSAYMYYDLDKYLRDLFTLRTEDKLLWLFSLEDKLFRPKHPPHTHTRTHTYTHNIHTHTQTHTHTHTYHEHQFYVASDFMRFYFVSDFILYISFKKITWVK